MCYKAIGEQIDGNRWTNWR